jgi:hypothetical protein
MNGISGVEKYRSVLFVGRIKMNSPTVVNVKSRRCYMQEQNFVVVWWLNHNPASTSEVIFEGSEEECKSFFTKRLKIAPETEDGMVLSPAERNLLKLV